jgi:hypothetical protein
MQTIQILSSVTKIGPKIMTTASPCKANQKVVTQTKVALFIVTICKKVKVSFKSLKLLWACLSWQMLIKH